MEPLPEKTGDQWLEWKVSFCQQILTGFMQINHNLDQMQDLINDFKEEKIAEAKSQPKEIPESCILKIRPDNIEGMMCHQVRDVVIAARTIEVKNRTIALSVVPPFKTQKKTESQRQKKHMEKKEEVNAIYTIADLLSVSLRQKESERGDLFYNCSWCSDGAGIT